MRKITTKPKSAAVLTVFDAPNMTPAGLKSIADWMRRQARALVREGKLYGPRMTARYLY